MLRSSIKITTCALTAAMMFSTMNLNVSAATVSSVLPNGGVNIALYKGTTLEALQTQVGESSTQLESIVEIAQIEEVVIATSNLVEVVDEKKLFENLVIARVNDYVNVRSIPSEEGEILGKLYNKSVGTFLGEENGWYLIQSGSVTGYVKAEYCVTGEPAVALAKEVGTRIATVNCDGLFVRKEASTDAPILGMVAFDDDLLAYDETDEWVLVDTEEGMGWVSKEYVNMTTEFVQAESKEEEAARKAKEEEESRKAREAAQRATSQNAASSSSSKVDVSNITVSGDSEMGVAVAEYALQFVGNPYKWGGTSLTDGADCSGFVLSVYSNFGVSLPHSSSADRSQGYAVEGLENAQAGDLICYSGHVALYIGGGQIVHASTAKTGIIVSKADYKKILAIRRIF